MINERVQVSKEQQQEILYTLNFMTLDMYTVRL